MRRTRNILISVLLTVWLTAAREADKDVPEGFEPLFNGKDLSGWKVHGGKMDAWGAENGIIFTTGVGGGWLLTEKEYDNFELQLEYKVPKGGNSGVGLRAPRQGDIAYSGMEIQILDDPAPEYKNIRPGQHTGSIYDVVPSSKQPSKPVGEWNRYHITAKGRQITVELNGEKIVDANLDDYKDHAKKTSRHHAKDRFHRLAEPYRPRGVSEYLCEGVEVA
jgi:Domain of Unknown Function (DUF1080).